MLLGATIWGGHYTVIKYGLRVLEPFTFAAIRMVSALIILSILALSVRDAPKLSRRDLKGLLAIGLIGNGFYQLLFMVGMTTTRAGIAALIIAASPAWVAIIGQLMGRERVSMRTWTGIGLQLVGVACVVLSTHALAGAGQAAIGTILILVASVLWSLYTVLLQPYTTRVHPLHLASVTLVSGAALMLVVAIPGLIRLDVRAVALSGWVALTYSTLLAMVVAYLLYYRGIRVIGPTRTAVYGNLQPVIAIIVAWALLKEAPGLWQWIGTALIMLGLLLSRSAPLTPVTDTQPILQS